MGQVVPGLEFIYLLLPLLKAFVYGLLCYIFKVEEVRELGDKVKEIIVGDKT